MMLYFLFFRQFLLSLEALALMHLYIDPITINKTEILSIFEVLLSLIFGAVALYETYVQSHVVPFDKIFAPAATKM